MIVYQNRFASEEEKRAFVLQCEKNFEDQLTAASREIAADGEISYVTLAGPTCSGKTTTASKLISDLGQFGRTVHVVSFDNFYRERAKLKTIVGRDGREQIDYDSVRAIDLEQLSRTLTAIFAHRDVQVPVYDFEAGLTKEYQLLDLSPGDLVIFEGIQAVYPEIVSLLSAHKYKSIYISVRGELEVGGRTFSGRDIRFWRRVVRDFKYRGATPEFSYYIWESVCHNEDRNMTPYAGQSDITINSLMPYEPGMIKEHLTRILGQMPSDNAHTTDAQDILARFDGVEEISPEYLPEKSVYHEFIG